MRCRSARLLFAFVLITKSSISWQYPTDQTQRRLSRDIIFPQDHFSIGTRVTGGEDSDIPGGVGAIYGGADGIHSLPPPPIVIPKEVKPRPSKEEIILNRLAEIRQANTRITSGGRPPIPLLDQGVGSFVVNDRDLERYFQYCGHFLERCQVANTPTNTGNLAHLHNRPVRNDGFHHGHLHSPFSQPSLPGNIPIWPG